MAARSMRRCELVRRSLGLTQAEAAKACGISLRVLNGVESGRTNATAAEAEKLAEGYGLDMADPLRLLECITPGQAAEMAAL